MKIHSNLVKETLKIGHSLARHLKKGDILCLIGELGSGKTVLTKGIASGLGIAEKDVISPSFVIIRALQNGRIPLYHFDLYRLKGPEDILPLGYQEYLYDEGVTVIEWAQRLGKLLPEECLKIRISGIKENRRLLEFSATGERYKELLKKLHENTGH